MHIAIFAETFLPKWDGITNTLCHLLDHLAARGHPAMMFAPEGAPAHYAAATIRGLRSFRFPLYPDLKLALPPLAVSPELAAFRPDLVHLASPVSLGLAGLREARALGVPIVASYHTDVPGYATLYGLDLLREPLWTYFRWVHNLFPYNVIISLTVIGRGLFSIGRATLMAPSATVFPKPP